MHQRFPAIKPLVIAEAGVQQIDREQMNGVKNVIKDFPGQDNADESKRWLAGKFHELQSCFSVH